MKHFLRNILTAMCSFSALTAVWAAPLTGSGHTVRHYSFSDNYGEKQIKTRKICPSLPDMSGVDSRKMPLAISRAAEVPEVGHFYGYLVFSGIPSVLGLNEFDSEGQYNGLWSDPLFQENGSLMSGWYYNGRVCGYCPYSFNDLIYRIDYVEIDFATGEIVERTTLSTPILFLSTTLNDSDGYVYGYASTENGLAFARCPADNPTDITVVKSVSSLEESHVCQSLAYNPVDRSLYGVCLNGDFVKIDRLGNQTVIFSTAGSVGTTDVITGLAYSTTHGRFFWNFASSNSSGIYWISPTDRSVTTIQEYYALEQFSFIFAGNESYYTDAPARPEFAHSEFDKGAGSGTLVFKAPALYNNGEVIKSSVVLDWSMAVDGEHLCNGTAAPGATIRVLVNGLSTGTHTFTMRMSAEGKTGLSLPVSLYIGHDTPSKPTDVKLDDNGHLTWAAVTTGSHGGYVDASAISYSISLNGSVKGTTTSTSFDLELPSDVELTPYTASVTAISDEKYSEPAYSNTVVAGRPLVPDYVLEPKPEETGLFSVEDVNGDGVTWVAYDSEDYDSKVFFSGYSEIMRMDDWLFLPATAFDDTFYSLEFEACYFNINYPSEFLEVKFGNAPHAAAMTGSIMEPTRIVEPDFATYGGRFRVPSSGTWYIGIHCMSQSDMAGIFMRRFNVRKLAVTDSSVGAVTDIRTELTEGPNGDVAKVSFRMPVTTIGGETLPADSQIKAVVSASTEAIVTGRPGSEQIAEVEINSLINRIDITTWIGEEEGATAWVNIYTGLTNPEKVDNLKVEASEDNMTARISWLAPIEDKIGNILNPDDLVYNVFLWDQNSGGGSWVPVAAGIKETSFEYNLEQGADQTILTFGVQAANSIGVNQELSTAPVMLGTPTKVPFKETFVAPNRYQSGFFVHTPADDYTLDWAFVADKDMPVPSDGRGYVLIFEGDSRTICRGRMSLPAFTTKGCVEGSFHARIWTGTDAATTSFLYEYYGSNGLKELCTVGSNNNWLDLAVDLPEDAIDKGWVRVYIDTDISRDGQYFAMSEYSLSHMSGVESIDTDLVASPSVKVECNVIVVEGCTGQTVTVTTPDGRQAGCLNSVEGTAKIELPGGIYIVNAGATTAKIIIK